MTDCNFPTQCNFPNCFCTGLKRKTDTDHTKKLQQYNRMMADRLSADPQRNARVRASDAR